jgi:hypothetical protein
MGAYEGLSHYFNQPLYNYAINLGYDESNVLILEGQINQLQNRHLNIYNNLLSCRHHSDRRTPLEYGQDLVASWLFEDYFINEMQNDDFEIHHAGTDKTRLILPNQRTSTSSDYIITTSTGTQILMDLVNDYTGFWYRNQKLHLRDNKYLQLCNHHSLLLAIALSTNAQKYTIFDFREDIPARRIESHRPYGGKPAYELSVSQESLNDFSFVNVKNSIINIIADCEM